MCIYINDRRSQKRQRKKRERAQKEQEEKTNQRKENERPCVCVWVCVFFTPCCCCFVSSCFFSITNLIACLFLFGVYGREDHTHKLQDMIGHGAFSSLLLLPLLMISVICVCECGTIEFVLCLCVCVGMNVYCMVVCE